MKVNEKIKAVSLRKRGFSYSEIQKSICVSKSTLHRWLVDILMSAPQKEKLMLKRRLGAKKGAKIKHEARIALTQKIYAESQKEFVRLKSNPLFLAGLFLYWAEGDKHKHEDVKFTNSDPYMVKLMIRWFREVCHVPANKFRIGLHIHNLHVSEDVKKYWARLTEVPEAQFKKVYIKETSLGQRKNILYNGTCSIVVNNKNLFRKIQGWKSGLLKFFKITTS